MQTFIVNIVEREYGDILHGYDNILSQPTTATVMTVWYYRPFSSNWSIVKWNMRRNKGTNMHMLIEKPCTQLGILTSPTIYTFKLAVIWCVNERAHTYIMFSKSPCTGTQLHMIAHMNSIRKIDMWKEENPWKWAHEEWKNQLQIWSNRMNAKQWK